MAWTSPRTYSACEVITAAICNTHIRDNFNQTFPALVTTKGDSVWATAANAGTRVAVGTDGDFMGASSGCNAGVRWTTGQVNYAGSVLSVNHRITVTQAASNQGEFAMAGCGVTNNWRLLWDDAAGNGLGNGGCTLEIWHGITKVVAFFGGSKVGQVAIGTNTNPQLTQGANLHQGTNTNQILALQNSSTSQTTVGSVSSSTFGFFQPLYATEGGLLMVGLSGPAGGGATRSGLRLDGNTANTHATRSSTASAVIVMATCSLGSIGDNVFSVVNSSCTQFIVSGQGDVYANATVNACAYDNHDDVQLVRALEVERNPGSVIRDQFDAWLKYNREDLSAADIAHFDENGSIFVSITGLQRLHSGAIWQTHKYVRQLEDRISQLERLLIGPPKATT